MCLKSAPKHPFLVQLAFGSRYLTCLVPKKAQSSSCHNKIQSTLRQQRNGERAHRFLHHQKLQKVDLFRRRRFARSFSDVTDDVVVPDERCQEGETGCVWLRSFDFLSR